MHIKSTSVAILTSLAFAASLANAAETRDPVVPKFEIEFSANEVIGAEVTNNAGESVGEIHEILFTNEGAPISMVILVGGFLGIGDKLVAVQFHDIEIEEDGDLTLDATREELENRAPFDYENVSLVQLAPIDFGSIAATEGQDERARYLEKWSNRLAAWEEKVEDSSRMGELVYSSYGAGLGVVRDLAFRDGSLSYVVMYLQARAAASSDLAAVPASGDSIILECGIRRVVVARRERAFLAHL